MKIDFYRPPTSETPEQIPEKRQPLGAAALGYLEFVLGVLLGCGLPIIRGDDSSMGSVVMLWSLPFAIVVLIGPGVVLVLARGSWRWAPQIFPALLLAWFFALWIANRR